MAEIRLRGLAHSYLKNPENDEDFALKTIEHTWRQGGAYALLGPSGCGKSTLLNVISGLITPTKGDVLFDGAPMTNASIQQRNIAQVFQFPVVYDNMTVAQNLAFPLKNAGLSAADIAPRVDRIAALLELTDVLNAKARYLSAAQKQKISMGRGLVRDDVAAILFDEPLTVIDPHIKWQLRRKLKQLHEQLNVTMVYVTHDQLEAATFADEIAVMHEGRIVQSGTPQALFERPEHTFVGYFIGSPGMNFAHQQDTQAFTALRSLASAFQQNAIQQHPDAKLTLGARPEFLTLHALPKEDSIPVTICDTTAHGSYQLITVTVGEVHWQVRVADDWRIEGDSAYLGCMPSRLLLYRDHVLLAEADDA